MGIARAAIKHLPTTSADSSNPYTAAKSGLAATASNYVQHDVKRPRVVFSLGASDDADAAVADPVAATLNELPRFLLWLSALRRKFT